MRMKYNGSINAWNPIEMADSFGEKHEIITNRIANNGDTYEIHFKKRIKDSTAQLVIKQNGIVIKDTLCLDIDDLKEEAIKFKDSLCNKKTVVYDNLLVNLAEINESMCGHESPVNFVTSIQDNVLYIKDTKEFWNKSKALHHPGIKEKINKALKKDGFTDSLDFEDDLCTMSVAVPEKDFVEDADPNKAYQVFVNNQLVASFDDKDSAFSKATELRNNGEQNVQVRTSKFEDN